MAPPDREGAAGLGEAIVAQCSLCCGLQAQSLAPPVPPHSFPPPPFTAGCAQDPHSCWYHIGTPPSPSSPAPQDT